MTRDQVEILKNRKQGFKDEIKSLRNEIRIINEIIAAYSDNDHTVHLTTHALKRYKIRVEDKTANQVIAAIVNEAIIQRVVEFGDGKYLAADSSCILVIKNFMIVTILNK